MFAQRVQRDAVLHQLVFRVEINAACRDAAYPGFVFRCDAVVRCDQVNRMAELLQLFDEGADGSGHPIYAREIDVGDEQDFHYSTLSLSWFFKLALCCRKQFRLKIQALCDGYMNATLPS